MFSNQLATTKEAPARQEFHQQENQASRFRASPAPSPAQPCRTQSPRSPGIPADQRRRSRQQKSAIRTGPAFSLAPQEYQSPPEYAEKRAQLFSSQSYFSPKASAFNAFGGRRPSKSATTFSAAITAIFVRVSKDALAICGAKITSRRVKSAGCTSGSCS